MVWLQAVLALEEGLRHGLDAATALLDRMPTAERAVATDRLVSSQVDAMATRALGYRAFAKLVRGGTAPEQALMKVFCTEAERRLEPGRVGDEWRYAPSAAGRAQPLRRGLVDRALLLGVRQHDLGRVVRDSAQHHRNQVLGLPRK